MAPKTRRILKLNHLFSFLLKFLVASNLAGCTQDQNTIESSKYFRLHLFKEPSHLDPSLGRSSSNQYLHFNISRGLYRWTEAGTIEEEGGRCAWIHKLKLRCEIFNSHVWSDGSQIFPEDYRRAFLHLLDPNFPKPRSYLLKNLNISSFKIIKTKSGRPSKIFELHFYEPDSDFLEKLTSTALTPRHKNFSKNNSFSSHISSGPYKILEYVPGQRITLSSNIHYKISSKERPPVLFYFISEDSTAHRLYKKKQLDFLRRLPISFIRKYKDSPELVQKPVARFDYIGFGPRLSNNRKLRKAFAQGLHFKESQILLSALGPLGCSSLPPHFFDQEKCFSFEKMEGLSFPSRLTYAYSHMGGSGISLQAQWLQAQWRNNIGASVEIRSIEQKSFLRTLKTRPPDLFRKGVGLDYPSCLAALEVFSKKHPKNYSSVEVPKLDLWIKKYRATFDSVKKKQLCSQGLEFLSQDFWYIPLGKMHFSLLSSPSYTGWTLNSLNQLDLSNLRRL